MLSATRKERRMAARAETRRTRKLRRAVVALGAGVVIAAGTAGQAYAESIDSQQVSQNTYATVQNLITIADNLGRTQIALLAPAHAALPAGWVPVTTSEYSTSTEQLNFLQVLTQGGQLLLAVPDTSHVPGATTTLSGISPQVAQALAAAPLAGTLGSGASVYTKMGAALLQLNGINVNTTIHNGLADVVDGLGGDRVTQHAGTLTGIPSIDDALGFWTGTRTSTSWTGSTSWLGATGTTWISQDKVTMNGITSDELKALFGQNLNHPDALVVAEGSTVIVTKCVWGICVPIGTKWVSETDEHGNQVHTTTYDPNSAVSEALSALDGIRVGGFSVIQRQAGGSYAGALGGTAGWLAAATQVVVPGVDGADDQVITVPVYAAGISLPDNLFTTGMQLSPGLVTTTGQSVDTVLGSRSSSWSIPSLGIGAQQTSLLQSSHLGPDGFAYDSGWTIATIDLGEATIPIVYSLGSFNMGPNGFGMSGPSFMGVGLPGFQIGSAPAGSPSTAIPEVISDLLGSVPNSVIALTPAMIFQLAQIEDPTGGALSDPIGTLQRVLSPLFTKYVTPTATQISQALADAATAAINQSSGQLVEASTQAAESTGALATAATQIPELNAPAPSNASAESSPLPDVTASGRHALPDDQASQFSSSGTTTPRHAAPEAPTTRTESGTVGASDAGGSSGTGDSASDEQSAPSDVPAEKTDGGVNSPSTDTGNSRPFPASDTAPAAQAG